MKKGTLKHKKTGRKLRKKKTPTAPYKKRKRIA